MGTLEKGLAKELRRGKIQSAVLKTVAVAGLISVALLAPNVMQVLDQLGLRTKNRRNRSISIYQSRNRLIQAGYLEWDPDKKGYLRLTEKGENKMKVFESGVPLRKPRRWDKKWRILIFDIHEHKRWLREKVRRTLRQIGFERLQNSVWVYPYDCEDLITLLKADFKIGKELLYLIVDRIENDRGLREKFLLPQETV